MRTAIYVRVSTEEQAKEGYSIDGQKQHLKRYCIENNWEVVGIYVDEGLSAKDMNRPQLQSLLKQIEKGNVDHVLVYKLDRITRSVPDLYRIKEIMDKHNCSIKSATEAIDTSTPMGRLVITMSAGMAQWERETIGERISFGLVEKARQGKYPLNTPPLGYDIDKETRKLVVNKEEAKLVRLIHKLYRKWGTASIARYLNERNYVGKNGCQWHAKSVRQVLEGYPQVGKILWKGKVYEGNHEPIISLEEWKNTQHIIDRRKNEQPRTISSDYIFSGKLVCPTCGGNLTGVYTETAGKKYYNYKCRRHLDGRCKGSKNVSQIKIEKAFIDFLGKQDYETLLDNVAREGEQQLNKHDDDINIEELKKRLDKLENKKKKWQYAWAEDIMSYEDFKKRMEESQREENDIKKQLSKVEETAEPKKINKKDVIGVLQSIKENWLFLTNEEKKVLVSEIIEKIHYEHIGKRIIIKYITFM